MNNHDLKTLREAIGKITQMLAGMGLRVTQQGSKAYVKTDLRTLKPVRVNIPNLPDTASEALISAIQGFIDHEVAHILSTDWAIVRRAMEMGEEMASLHNIVEDTFVEREIRKKFPGSIANLRKTYKFFLDNVTRKALAPDGEARTPEDAFRYMLVPIVRAWAGQEEFQAFLDEIDYTKNKYVEHLILHTDKAITDRIPKIRSSAEALEVAHELFKIIYPEPPPAKGSGEGKPSSAKASGSGDPGTGKSGSDDKSVKDNPSKDEETADIGAVSKKAKPPEEDAGDSTEEEEKTAGKGKEEKPEHEDNGEDSDDKKNEKDSDDGDADEAEDSGYGAEEKEKTENEDEKGAGIGSSSDSGDSNEEEIESRVEVIEEAEGSGVTPEGKPESPFGTIPMSIKKADFEAAMNEVISDMADDAIEAATYAVFTKDYDRIELYDPDKFSSPVVSDHIYRAIDEESRAMVGKMQKDIERMMAQKHRIFNTPGFRRGRLNPNAMHRIVLGEEKVFRKKTEIKAKDTAVCLLVDSSGSMRSHKYKTAMMSAYALSQTLDRINIKHECLGFTTLTGRIMGRSEAKEMADALTGVPYGEYARREGLYIPIYKEYAERLTPVVRNRFSHAMEYQEFLCENVDGESVEIAANRLLARQEQRKVLLVLSDGAPACSGSYHTLNRHLKDMVEKVEKSGIEIVGIGIQSTAVERFYSRTIVINKAEELPAAVIGQLKRILIK